MGDFSQRNTHKNVSLCLHIVHESEKQQELHIAQFHCAFSQNDM